MNTAVLLDCMGSANGFNLSEFNSLDNILFQILLLASLTMPAKIQALCNTKPIIVLHVISLIIQTKRKRGILKFRTHKTMASNHGLIGLGMRGDRSLPVHI